MKLFNTLGRKKEEFKLMPGGKEVKIYSCGPTVYSSPTIGNMRAYIFVDVLKRTLEMKGFSVKDVMNITDVGHLQSDGDEGEDKVEVAARKAKITASEVATRYTDEFFRFCDMLNIRRSSIVAPATKYIDKMVEHIKELEAKGLTYLASDGLYFDSSKFEKYYALSGKKPNAKDSKKGVGDKAGARVSMSEKRNSNDFCLWRRTPSTALQKWDSPWGVGVPGWHIECSVIARAELGDTIDIHTGGVDHVAVNHTNEIAQSESLTGKPFSRFWLHNEFIMIDGGKMSKSLGNVYTVDDIVAKGYSPLSFRYLVLQSHYRSIMNFTWESVKAADTAYKNLVKELSRHKTDLVRTNQIVLDKAKKEFQESLIDDLNTAKGLAVVWELLKKTPCALVFDLVLELDKVLGLGLENAVEEYLAWKNEKKEAGNNVKIPAVVKKMADARMEAKARKDWAVADKLREEIRILGYEVVDVSGGYEIKTKQQN